MCKTMFANYVVGFTGTSGSFGKPGSRVVLPSKNSGTAGTNNGFILEYPSFQYLDKDGAPLLVRDSAGIGGVEPTHYIPRSPDILIAYARGVVRDDVDEDVEVLYVESLLLP